MICNGVDWILSRHATITSWKACELMHSTGLVLVVTSSHLKPSPTRFSITSTISFRRSLPLLVRFRVRVIVNRQFRACQDIGGCHKCYIRHIHLRPNVSKRQPVLIKRAGLHMGLYRTLHSKPPCSDCMSGYSGQFSTTQWCTSYSPTLRTASSYLQQLSSHASNHNHH